MPKASAKTKKEAKPKVKKPSKAAASKAKGPQIEVDMKTRLNEDEGKMADNAEDELRAKYILIIQRYQVSLVFGEYLKSMGIKYTSDALQKKTIAQLEGIIRQVKFFINNRGSNGGLDHLLFGATDNGEKLVTGVTRGKYNLTGWTADLQQNGMFLEAWEQIKIERLSFMNTSPEVRFTLGLDFSAMNVIAANKQVAAQQLAAMQTQVNAASIPQDLLDGTPNAPNTPPVVAKEA